MQPCQVSFWGMSPMRFELESTKTKNEWVGQYQERGAPDLQTMNFEPQTLNRLLKQVWL